MLYSAVAQVSFVALVCVALLAAAAKDRIVRLSALLHIVNWVLVAVFQRRHEHHVFQMADFSIDVVGAVLASLIAAFSRRVWTAALAAFQALGALNWLLPVLDLTVQHRAYMTVSYIWEAGALMSLLWGAVAAHVEVWRRHISLERVIGVASRKQTGMGTHSMSTVTGDGA